MEAATAAPATEPDVQPETAVAGDPATATPQQLFAYSTWVHVGPGAEECGDVDEQAGTNECSNPLHFHAWCRLPNQFQHKEIREKALAAKARHVRLLRDEQTDAYAIMEDELDRLARAGDEVKEALVEEITSKDWFRDTIEAARELAEHEEDDGSKPYEFLERDQQRFRELAAMPDDERPKDEFESLERHLARYDEVLEAKSNEIAEPKKAALAERDVNALIDMVRDDRIERASHDEFMHVYNTWEWYVGTLIAPGGTQRWPSLEAMQQAAPEVLNEIQDIFNDLERSKAQGVSGNS